VIAVPDCRKCGACCVGEYADHYHAICSPSDVVRMSRKARKRLVTSSFRDVHPGQEGYAKTDGEARCVFLRGTVGSRCSCRIYETRPKVCRDFKAGARICADVRRAFFGEASP